jgi:hypothetical protein
MRQRPPVHARASQAAVACALAVCTAPANNAMIAKDYANAG